MRMRKPLALLLLVALGVLGACNTQGSQNEGGGDTNGASGSVRVDGSSTVFPISEALAEEFRADTPGVNVRVGQSGTGGGFEKFCAGEIDIADASRPIDDEEQAACTEEGVEPVELKIALDGLSVVVHSSNEFVDCLTTDQLRDMWVEGSEVTTWQDVNEEWPAEEIKLYGPGSDSGTFDFFNEEILGEDVNPRSDYTASEDDNTLVRGVAEDESSLGYFGYAYVQDNAARLRAVEIDGGDGCTAPSVDTIQDGSYKPLSRPLFIYTSVQSLEKEPVRAFAEFYLETVNAMLEDVKYVPIPDADLEASKEALSEHTR